MKNQCKLVSLIISLICLSSYLTGCNINNNEEEKPVTYFNVSFDGNGGTLVSGEESQMVSSSSKIKEPVYTRTGYIFNGWSTNIEEINSYTTVLATWKPNRYLVNVYSNDEDKGIVTGSGNFDFDSNVTIKADAKENYYF